MSISTYKVTKKSAHIQVFSFYMCRLNYGLSLYRDFFSALAISNARFCMRHVADSNSYVVIAAGTVLFCKSCHAPLRWRHAGERFEKADKVLWIFEAQE